MPHIEKIREFCAMLDNMHIETYYQSIYDLKTGETIGYEAKSRGGENSRFNSYKSLVKMARILEREWDLEIAAKTNAVSKAAKSLKDKKLFVTVDPQKIYDRKDSKSYLQSLTKAVGVDKRNVVVQVSEKGLEEDNQDFISVIKYYWSLGFTISIDRVFNIHMGLKSISQTKPAFVKLDKRLIENIDTDIYKQNVVRSFIQIANNNFVKTIAVGITSYEQLKTLTMLGVDYGQGKLFGKFTTDILNGSEIIKNEIIKHYNANVEQGVSHEDSIYVRSLVKDALTIENSMLCEDVKKYFIKTKEKSLVVMQSDKPIGLVARDRFDSYLSTRYGFSLNCKKPITNLMSGEAIIMDEFTPVYTAAQRALKRDEEHLYNDVIVTRGGKYLGIVTMKSIINYTINYEKNKAIELNPLTSLTGNVAIDKNLKKLLRHDGEYGLFYLDIDKFKVFNDLYGFKTGDKVILMVSEILVNVVKSSAKGYSFIGHIGGDDFVFIMEGNANKFVKVCEKVISKFDQKVAMLINKKGQDISDKVVKDRNGNEVTAADVSISMAGLFGDFSRFSDPDKLSQHMAQLKSQVKEGNGSNYLISEIE